MLINKQAQALRNPELRKNMVDFKNPAGSTNEKELMNMAGAGDIMPLSTWPCAMGTVYLSYEFCPTTACTKSYC